MISLCCELTAVIVFQKILHFSRIAALFGNIVRSEFIVGTVILAGSGMQKELDCVSIGFSGCHVKRSDAAKRSCVHIGAFADQVLDHFLVAGRGCVVQGRPVFRIVNCGAVSN